MSYGMGLIVGSVTGNGPATANKVVAWELKKLTKFGRWLMKHLFQAVADFFGYLAKQCGPKKKTTP